MNIQPTVSGGATRAEEPSLASEAPRTPPISPFKENAAAASTGKAKAGEDAEPSQGQLKAAVARLNDSLGPSTQDLQFSVDEDSKRTVVKLIDRNTHEVLRQMPSKEALEIAKSLDKVMGKLIDQHA